ncbi:hypothetical protein C1646_758847 [Rhizophagus diaphanus]|nr:hypothetical protein C1646_758847 [Rhizophagus diaphanus] [Rhizophagus sp. MUCL 43196]
MNYCIWEERFNGPKKKDCAVSTNTTPLQQSDDILDGVELYFDATNQMDLEKQTPTPTPTTSSSIKPSYLDQNHTTGEVEVKNNVVDKEENESDEVDEFNREDNSYVGSNGNNSFNVDKVNNIDENIEFQESCDMEVEREQSEEVDADYGGNYSMSRN